MEKYLSGVKVSIIEVPYLQDKDKIVVGELDGKRMVYVKDLYRFAFKTLPFNTALDACISYAQDKIIHEINRKHGSNY